MKDNFSTAKWPLPKQTELGTTSSEERLAPCNTSETESRGEDSYLNEVSLALCCSLGERGAYMFTFP